MLLNAMKLPIPGLGLDYVTFTAEKYQNHGKS